MDSHIPGVTPTLALGSVGSPQATIFRHFVAAEPYAKLIAIRSNATNHRVEKRLDEATNAGWGYILWSGQHVTEKSRWKPRLGWRPQWPMKWQKLPELGQAVFDFNAADVRDSWTLESGNLTSVFTNSKRQEFQAKTEHFVGTAEVGQDEYR